jgi:hypothetical protein
MKTPNENGVYEPEAREELARVGRSYAVVKICQCDDGLYRYALDVMYSYGGFSGPITADDDGFPTFKTAKDAGTERLLKRFPSPWPSDPKSVHEELAAMRAQIERNIRQPSLF